MECPILNTLIDSATGTLTLLVVRLVLTAGLKRLLTVHRRRTSSRHSQSSPADGDQQPAAGQLSSPEDGKSKQGKQSIIVGGGGHNSCFNSSGVYVGGLVSLYQLVTHTEDRNPADLLQYTVLAIWITDLLQQTGFFGDDQLFNEVGPVRRICTWRGGTIDSALDS